MRGRGARARWCSVAEPHLQGSGRAGTDPGDGVAPPQGPRRRLPPRDRVAALLAPAAARALRSLQCEIAGLGGTGYVLGYGVVAGQAEIITADNRVRDEEYSEILGRCADFAAEIERELPTRHLIDVELEENDEDLVKLRG